MGLAARIEQVGRRPDAPPVLVLSPPRFTGPLGVVRSLGCLGVRVYALDHEEASLVRASRYCAGRVTAGRNGHPDGFPEAEIADQLVAGGRQLMKHGARPILLSGSDAWAQLVAHNADRLREVFTFPEVPAELVCRLTSKVGLQELARRHGLATPRIARPGSVEEAVRMAEEMGFPVVLKNVRSIPGQRLGRAADARELVRRFTEMSAAGEVVVQELVPGEDGDVWMYNGYYDRSSRCLAWFTGRKLRQVPPGLGTCTAGVCADNPELAAQAEAFLGAIGYRGVVDIDFRRDPRDGTYKVLDVNPRLGGVFRLFVDPDGLDVVRAMYLDLTGLEVPAHRPNDGRRWVTEAADLIAARHYRRRGLLTLRAWARSLVGTDELATLSASDPLPFLVSMSMLAGGACTQICQRRLPPRRS
jgi:D-aspartate ligase